MASWQSRVLQGLLRVIRLKRLFDPAHIDGTIRRDRKRGPARPGKKTRETLKVTHHDVEGRAVTVVAPRDHRAPRTVLYLHGGGFVMSMTDPHWGMVHRLCRRLDARVVVPDYPLHPEHTAAGVHDWLRRFYLRLIDGVPEQGDNGGIVDVDPARLSIMGDSAGGNLSLTLPLHARQQGWPLPSSLVLFSPALVGGYDDPRRVVLDRSDAMLDLKGLEPLALRYAGDLAHDDPRLAPLASSLRGLPPIAVFASTSEILWVDALALREKATTDGVDITLFAYDQMVHAWPIFPIPEGLKALDETVAFVLKHETVKTTAQAD